MFVSGPLAITPLNPTPGQELNLRPFQRVTAEVLQVTNTQAVLSIDGYPVVASLASADQAAELLSQRTAQFIVTQNADQTLALKLIHPGQQSPAAGEQAIVLNTRDLATRLLEQTGLPVTASTLTLARAALNQHLQVTPDMMAELMGVLNEYGAWGDREAELAAAIKAAGLPLSAGTLELAARTPTQIGTALNDLIQQLQNALGKKDLPTDVANTLQKSLQILQEGVLKWNAPTDQMAERLHQSAALLGRSLESLLKEQLQGSDGTAPDKGLLTLARLQQSLGQAGQHELADKVGHFLEDMRQSLLLNVKPDPVPGRGEWTDLGFLLKNPERGAAEQDVPARLRIAHQASSPEGKINPSYTRLVIQVDLEAGQTMEVDLSVVGKQLRADILTPDSSTCLQAREELPSLAEAFQKLGYQLKDSQVDIGYPQAISGLLVLPGSRDPLLAVNIEA